MPKIRIKHLKDSQLEKYTEKSYETVEGITTLTTSGILNSNNKKRLNDKFNISGKYNIELIDSYGEGKYKKPDPFNDNNTLEFLSFSNTNTVLGIPAIKLEGKNDFYITTDSYLLTLDEIPAANQASLNENFLVSNSLIQTPNFIDFRNFLKNTTARPKVINQNQIKQNTNTIEHTPFVEKTFFDDVSADFVTDSIVYENESYNVGDQQTINLTLDFSDAEDAYLLNTTLFYKSGEKFSDFENPTPDTVFATNQVNLTNLSTPMSITSHFLPNVIWNNVDRRWEYNVIEQNKNLHLGTYQYNNSNESFFFPNAITNLHNFSTAANESETIENTFKLIHNYIENSPICFTESYDRFNNLVENQGFIKYNSITDTYGFPNSSLWKTNPSHSIKMENYLPGDFLVEKVIFEGNLDVKAEVPTKKGNFYNNLQTNNDYADSILYTNQTEYDASFSHNQNSSDYIASSINFYLLRVEKNRNNIKIPKINGYQIKNNESTLSLSDYTLTQNEDNPYIDVALSDLSEKYYYDSLTNDYVLGDEFKDNQKLVFKPIKNSVYESLKIDDYNNINKNRKNRQFFYLGNITNPIDLSNNNYVSIETNTDFQTDLYDDLSINDISKQLYASTHNDFNSNIELDLITHNSISFIKTKSNIVKAAIDNENIDSDVVIDIPVGNNLNIDIDDYDFKIANKLNKNVLTTQNISESVFGLTSNYQYEKVTPAIQKNNIIFYDYENILDLLSAIYAVGAGISDGSFFLGMPTNYFVNYDGTNNVEADGDINIEFVDLNSNIVYTSRIQLTYNTQIDNNVISANDFISTEIITSDQALNNVSLTKVNVAVLNNNDFVTFLIEKSGSYNIEGIELDTNFRNNFLSRKFDVNSDNIIFDNLTTVNQVLCFIRLLDIVMLNIEHSFEGQTYYPFINIKRHEADINTVRLLNSNIQRQFNYSSELILNNKLINNYNVSEKYSIRLYSNSLNNTFEIPDSSYGYGKSLFDDEYSTNFYRIIFGNSGVFNSNNDIQTLETIRFFVDEQTANYSLEEEIGILNSTYENYSKRQLNLVKKFNVNENDNISRSGKLINKSGKYSNKENLSYILKNTDELVVGINSFSGFNNLISYAKINKKLNITLIGRELHKKEKSVASESTNITSSIIGSQRLDTLYANNKVTRLSSNKNKYVTDTILPGIGKVYSEILNKDILVSNKDSFDTFINRDAFNNIKSNVDLRSNRLIFTTKNRSNDKYVNVVSDWHKTYYLSKNRSLFNEKELENSTSYFKNKNNIAKTFVYLDVDSYSFNKQYSTLLSDSIIQMNPELDSIKNLAFTPCNFMLPRDFNYIVNGTEGSFVEKSIRHPGLRIKYINDNSNENYKFTKDLTNTLNNQIIAFNVLAKTDVMTLQYLSIPTACVDSFNIDDTSFSSNKKMSDNDFRNSWCIVIEAINLSNYFHEKFNKFIEESSKIDLVHSIASSTKIYYDETFKLISVPINDENSLYPIYQHNFYVITQQDEISHVIMPISFLKNTTKTITDLSEENLLTSLYNINPDVIFEQHFHFNSNGAEDSPVCSAFPLSVEELDSIIGQSSVYYRISKNYITKDFAFYLPTFELLYPLYGSLKNVFKNQMSNSVYDKFNNEIRNKVRTGYQLSFYDKKVFTFNTEYLELRELIKNNKSLSVDYFINKKINSSFIYKKQGNHYVKTQNKLLYQISTKEIYDGSNVIKNSYIDCFGIERDSLFTNNDIRCMLTYDINENDTIRIYDEQYKNQINVIDRNYKSPYVEIDFTIQNPDIGARAIKYTHYSLDYDNVESSEFDCYGSPICNVDNKVVTNKFLYSYSNNKKYHYPVDKVSGYRYGVFDPNPVKQSVTFNTNHYGQFKDKTYDTQNYSTVEILNGKKFYKYTTSKKFLSDKYRFIDEETAATLSIFEGSNLDIYNRHYYPFIESTDGSDMSALYVETA